MLKRARTASRVAADTRSDRSTRRGFLIGATTAAAGVPAKMCRVVRQVRKPCLVYKLLAAGRQCGSPAEVRQAFEFAYRSIEATDAAIVGMYPRYSDQIGENARLVRELASAMPPRAVS